jgi:tetratricopeptide (TPR) repeat protein
VLLLTGVVAGCSPVWLHNYFVARDPVFLSAHSGLNYWIGNNPWATGYPKIPPGLRASQEGLLRDSITVPEQEIGRSLRRSEVSAYWSAKAKSWIEANRAAWWKLLGRKFANFWNAFQYDDLSIISLLRTQGIMPPGLRFGPVAALALPALLVALWREPRARWIGGAVAMHLTALMPVFVTERYRLCAVPGLLLFASYGLYALRNWITAHEWKPAIGFAGALASAAVFVWWPRNDPGLWSLDHYNTGIRALKSGNLDLAQRELERAHDLVEDNAEINFALGNLWLARGDHTKVKQFYRRTLELNPRHADCWNNLGVVAIEERAWRAAAGFLENSIHFEPDDAKTQYLLARALRATGDTTRARAALAEALKRRPKQPEFLALAAELDAPSP